MPKLLYEGCVLKPRSRDVHETAGGALLNKFKKDYRSWEERFLWLEQDGKGKVWLVYSEAAGEEELKRVALQDVKEIREVTQRNAVKVMGLKPGNLAQQVFCVTTTDKIITFACVDQPREEWVYLMRKYMPKEADLGQLEMDSSSETLYSDSTASSNPSVDGSDFDDYESDYDSEYDEYCDEDDEGGGGGGGGDDDGDEASLPSPTKPLLDAAPGGFPDGEGERPRKAGNAHIDESLKGADGAKNMAKVKALLEKKHLTMANVKFATVGRKLSSKNVDLKRVVVITTPTQGEKYSLYLIRKGHLRTSWTKIPICEIRGVLKNTQSKLQLAVLWGRGHDYLLSFTTDAESDAFVYHLKEAHQQVTRTNIFSITDSPELLADVRRTDRAVHQPLEQGPNDKYGVATDEDLYPSLRAHGDKKVHLSDVVRKENASGSGEDGHSDKLLVLTDQALYYYKPTGAHMDRRIYLRDIQQVLHDEKKTTWLIRVKTGRAQSYGAKGGDLMFMTHQTTRADRDKDFGDLFAHELREIRRTYFQQSSDFATVQRATLERMNHEKRFENRDALEKTVGKARRLGKRARGVVRRQRMALSMRARRAFGGVIEGASYVSEALIVQGLAGDAELGLSAALLAAAKECRVATRCLIGPEGNAVYTPATSAAVRAIKREAISRHPYGRIMSNVRSYYDGRSDADAGDIVWFACTCTSVLENPKFSNVHKVLVVTTAAIHLFADVSMGSTNPALREKALEEVIPMRDVLCFVGCAKAPQNFIIMARERHLVLSCKGTEVQSLRAYIYRRCSKSYERFKKRVPKLRLGEVGTVEALKILARSGPGRLPQCCLPGEVDVIHAAACERVLELLQPYHDVKVFFSSVAAVQCLCMKEERVVEEVLNHDLFLVVTAAALYGFGLAPKPKPAADVLGVKLPGGDRSDPVLAVKFRLDLAQLSDILVCKDDDRHVVLKSLHYEAKFTFTSAEGRRVNDLTEAGVVAALETAFGVNDAFHVVSWDAGHIQFRLWPVTKTSHAVVTKRSGKAQDIISHVLLRGDRAGYEVAVDEAQALMLILPSNAADDFYVQVRRAWQDWTVYAARGTRGWGPIGGPFSGIEVPTGLLLPTPIPNAFEIATSYLADPEADDDDDECDGKKKRPRHKLRGYAANKGPVACVAPAEPAAIWANYQMWFASQINIAVETDTTGERIGWELRRGAAVGLCRPRDPMAACVRARERAASLQGKAKELAKMHRYLRRQRFDKFEELSRDWDQQPSLRMYAGRGFRARVVWSRKHGQAKCALHYVDGYDLHAAEMTVGEAKQFCLKRPECKGFSFFNPGGAAAENDDILDVTFKMSKMSKLFEGHADRLDFEDLQKTACLGLFPNDSALVPLLHATTYLKVPGEVACWRVYGMQLQSVRRDLAQFEATVHQRVDKSMKEEDIAALDSTMKNLFRQGVDIVPSSCSAACGRVHFVPRNGLSQLGTIVQTLASVVPRAAFEAVIPESVAAMRGKLHSNQVLLTAILQRMSLRRLRRVDKAQRRDGQQTPDGKDGAAEPAPFSARGIGDFAARRLHCQAWETLAAPLVDDADDDRPFLEDIMPHAMQLWNVDVALALQDGSTNAALQTAMEEECRERLEDMEELFAEYNLPPAEDVFAWVERSVRHHWCGVAAHQNDKAAAGARAHRHRQDDYALRVLCYKDAQVTSDFASLRQRTFRLCIADRRMRRAVEHGDGDELRALFDEEAERRQESADDDVEEIGTDVLARCMHVYKSDAAKADERAALVRNAKNVLASAREVVANLKLHAESEVKALVDDLEELTVALQGYSTLESEAAQAVYIAGRLRGHLQAQAEAAVREAAAAAEVERMEAYMQRKSKAAQKMLDAKEVEKQRKEEAAANSVYAAALRMKERLEKTRGMNLRPHDSAGAKRQRECLQELNNAQLTAQANPHPTLLQAIALLEETYRKWDEILIGKEEQERIQLAKEVDEVVAGRDRHAFRAFLLKHQGKELPKQHLVKVKGVWNALVQQHTERKAAIQAVESAAKGRDMYDIANALEAAAKKAVDDDDPAVVKAREVLEELQTKLAGDGTQLGKSFRGGSVAPAPKEGKAAAKDDAGGVADDAGSGGGGSAPQSEASFVDTESEGEPSPSGGAFAQALHEGLSPSRSPVPEEPLPAAGGGHDPVEGGGGDTPPPPGASPPPAPGPSQPELLDAPAHGNGYCSGVYEAIMGLRSTCEVDEVGLMRVSPGNPKIAAYVEAWRRVIRHRLKKQRKGIKRIERFEVDVFAKIGQDLVKAMPEAEMINPVPKALKIFHERHKKLNKTKADDNVFFVQYLLQSGRFNDLMTELLMLKFQGQDTLKSLYEQDSLFNDIESVRYLLRTMAATKKFRFEFRAVASDPSTAYMLDKQDVQYLKIIDAAELPPKITPRPTKPAASATPPHRPGGGTPDPAEPEAGSPAAAAPDGLDEWAEAAEEDVAAAVEEFNVQTFTQQVLAQGDQFKSVHEVGKLKLAVRHLDRYTDGSKKMNKIRHGPRVRELYDEGKHRALGILAREQLFPAIVALMSHGFKKKTGTLKVGKRRHLWDFIIEVAEKNRKAGSLKLGALKLPEGIDTVTLIVEKKWPKSAAAKEAANRIEDFKLRALICYALNHQHLTLYLEALYDPEAAEINKEWLETSGKDAAKLLNPKTRDDVDAVLASLDAMGFNFIVGEDLN